MISKLKKYQSSIRTDQTEQVLNINEPESFMMAFHYIWEKRFAYTMFNSSHIESYIVLAPEQILDKMDNKKKCISTRIK